jgi:hypothetical protein
MTRTGNPSARHFLVCGMLLLLAGHSSALELQTVLDGTAVTPPARIAFREQRHNRMMSEALVLTGYLEYLEDGRLRKVVESPFQESFLIDRERVEIEQDGETRILSLNKSRSLKALLGGIEAILAGQAASLQRVFDYELTGTEANWSIQLVPKQRRIAKRLNGLLVTGDRESVTSIRVDLEGGEWHLMQIGTDKRNRGQ